MGRLAKVFYPRLAATNLKKNGSTYFPYMLTSVCSVLTFYTMHALAANPGLAQMPGADSLKMILNLGVIVVGLFSAILLFYTNGFLIKRRKKELGLYSILGMEKKHIARVLFYETLFTAAVSLLLGLAGGLLIGKLLFMLLMNILQFTTPIVYTVTPDSLLVTAALFAAVFALTLLTNLRQIHLADPINLLRGGQQGEKEPRVKWPLLVIGLLSLGGGYFIALTVKSPLDALLLFFVAVILVIIGTYCLFTAGSIALLKALKRKKSFYYKPGNFIAVSGMLYRMKQNAVGLANICILSTMVLVTVSTTVSLYIGQNDILRNRYPLDMSVSCPDTPEAIQATDELLTRLARGNEVTIPVRYGYSSIPYITAFRDGNGFYSAVPEGMNATPADIAVIRVMPLESYTRMTGKEVSLEEDEVLVYTDTMTTFGANTLVLNHVPLRVKAELDDLPLAPKRKDPAQPTVHLVCRDKEVMLHLAEILDMENQTLIYEQSFNITGGEEAAAAFSQAVKDAQDTIPGLRSDSQYLAKTSWYASFGGFLFIGIFLGLLFMMAAVLIIYYKQISEGYDDHDRFTIMQKVGMSRKEVHRTIMKQIRLVFFLPLAAAALHIVMALKVMVKMLGAFALTNTALIVTCTGVTLLLFAGLYFLVYTLTARTYFRLVQ